MREQLETLQHATTIYLHPNMPLLAEKLASKMPPGLDVTYFVNSGSEANDLAVTHGAALHRQHRRHRGPERLPRRLARRSMGLTSHHTWKFPVLQGPDVHHALCPDPYRSALGGYAGGDRRRRAPRTSRS